MSDGRLWTGNLAAARIGYELLFQGNPGDVGVLNNLAVVANRQGDKAAVAYAERAYKFMSQDAAVLDTLGWALVRHGDMNLEIGLLRDARKLQRKLDP